MPSDEVQTVTVTSQSETTLDQSWVNALDVLTGKVGEL